MRFFEFLRALASELTTGRNEDPSVVPRRDRAFRAPRAKDELGRAGEELAAARFKKEGWKILERNLSLPSCEIDIVARDGGNLVFVEVKTRRRRGYTDPYEEVPEVRRNRMRRAAGEYLRWRGLDHKTPLRFDITMIVWPEGEAPLFEHITDAF